MDWKTLLASTVVAAIITAIINIVKSIMDNKAKASESVKTFRYTKLYEIVIEWQKNNSESVKVSPSGEIDALGNEIGRNNNLQKCYQLAKPLVDKKYWGDIEIHLLEYNELVLQVVKQFAYTIEHVKQLTESNGKAEECFTYPSNCARHSIICAKVIY